MFCFSIQYEIYTRMLHSVKKKKKVQFVEDRYPYSPGNVYLTFLIVDLGIYDLSIIIQLSVSLKTLHVFIHEPWYYILIKLHSRFTYPFSLSMEKLIIEYDLLFSIQICLLNFLQILLVLVCITSTKGSAYIIHHVSF